jgi:hypothetical protein
MSPIATAPADELSRESDADFLARLEEDVAAPAPEPADDTPPPARADDAAPPAPEEGDPPAAAPAEDPVALARREAREEADREWQAKLDGTHGNVKQWQAAAEVARQEAARLAAQLAEADKAREAEFQQLIDGTQDAEQRRYWQEAARLDKEKRELARERAQIASERQATQALAQVAAQQEDQQIRGLFHESLLGFLDHEAKQRGLPAEVVAELRDDLAASPQLAVLAEAPPQHALRYWGQTGRWLSQRIDRAAKGHEGARAAAEVEVAQANRQRDAQTGRFAAGQPGATGAGGDRYARMSDAEFLALVEDQE